MSEKTWVTDALQTIVRKALRRALPHGSGINEDWQIEIRSTKIYCYNAFHPINEAGFYDGRAMFTFVIDLNDEGNWKIHFRGKRSQDLNYRYMIRDYLEDLFADFMDTAGEMIEEMIAY